MKNSKITLEISPGVHWVGVKDWDRRMFDRLIPLPNGTSYNSYLIQGNEKTVLVDTVNPGFEGELEEKVRQIVDPSEIDYIVMNHAEPDHANAILHMLSLTNGGKVLMTERGKELAQELHNITEDKIKAVEDGETLDLGGKTLKFIHAPWLHWPETMFTFYEEKGVLFPCDFFGSHYATSKFFDEQLGDELLNHARTYYGEIMMPFSKMVKQALDKIESLDISIIAPSHGPMYKNPETIIEAYESWSKGEVKKKVLVIYISMWGSTEKMANAVVDAITSEGVDAVPLNMATSDLSKIAAEIVDSSGIIIGTPTVLGGSHPMIHHVAYLARKLSPPTKFVGVIESYGWSGGATKQLSELLGNLDAETVGAVEVLGSPKEEDLEKIADLGRDIAKKVKE